MGLGKGKKGSKWSSDLRFSVFSVVLSIQMPALGASRETQTDVFFSDVKADGAGILTTIHLRNSYSNSNSYFQLVYQISKIVILN